MNRLEQAHDQGFSLVELMVAMAVGLILILGVTVLLVDSQRTRLVIERSSESQEGGQIVFAMMRRDVQLAGYRGCNTAVNLDNNLDAFVEGVAVTGTNQVTFSYFRPYPDARSSQVTVAGDKVTLVASDVDFPRAETDLAIGNCSQQERITKPLQNSDSHSFTVNGGFKGVYEDLGGTAPDQVHLYELVQRTYTYDDQGERLLLGGDELLRNLVSIDEADEDQPSFVFRENLVGGASTDPESYRLDIGVAGNDADESRKVFSTIFTKRNGL